MEELPNRLREIRVEKGWSQQRLADAAGCSKMQISTLERGEQSLDIRWMRRLAAALGVEPGELLLPADNPLAARNAAEARLIELARRLPPELRGRLVGVAEALAGPGMDSADEAA